MTDELDAEGNVVVFTNGGNEYLVIESGATLGNFNATEDFIVILSSGSDLSGFDGDSIIGS